MNDAKISSIAASVDGLNTYQLATDANQRRHAEHHQDDRRLRGPPTPTEFSGTPTLSSGRGADAEVLLHAADPDLAEPRSRDRRAAQHK